MVFCGSFTTFLPAWARQGGYAVWLPLEIALVFSRARLVFSRARKLGAPGPITRRTAGLLVGAREAGVIAGALLGGALITTFGRNLALPLSIPAIATTLCIFAVAFVVPDGGERNEAKIDTGGFAFLAAGFVVLYLFCRHETRQADPLIDCTVLFRRSTATGCA